MLTSFATLLFGLSIGYFIARSKKKMPTEPPSVSNRVSVVRNRIDDRSPSGEEIEARFMEFADSIPEGLFECDITGRLRYVNSSGLLKFQYTQQDIDAGLNILQAMVPEDRAAAGTSITEVLQGRTPKKIRYTGLRKDGSTFPLSVRSTPMLAHGKVTGLRGIVVDITEEVRTADVLRESERIARVSESKFRSYIETAPMGIFVADAEGHFVEVNGTAARLLGYAEDELLNLSVPDSLHPDSIDAGLRHFQNVVITGRADGELKLKSKDGLPVWVSLHAVRLDGSRFMAFCLDIADRKRSEAEVRKLSHAIEQIPVSVVITDTSGIIEYVNPRFLQVSGYAAEDVLGRNPRLLKSGETSGAEYKALWETIRDGRVWTGEFHNRKKNGELFWEWASISPLRDESNAITHFVGVKEDITEQKKAEDALRESESRFRELANSLPEMVFELDRYGKFTYINSVGYKMFGYPSVDHILGLEAQALIIPEDRSRLLQSAKDIMNGGTSRWNEYTGLRHNGTTFPFAVHSGRLVRDGVTAGVRGLVMDITQRKKAIEETQRSQMFLQSIFDNIPNMILIKDPATFRFVHVNKAAEALLGYSNADITGKDDFDIYPEPIAQAFREKDIQAVSHKRMVEIEHQDLLTRRNELRIMQTKKIPVLDDTDNALFLLVISTDITDRVHHEQEMRDLGWQLSQRNNALEQTLNEYKMMQNTLVQSEKMASIGQLTAGIAHEINNPLAFVSSNLNRFDEYFHDAISVMRAWQELGQELEPQPRYAARLESLHEKESQVDVGFIIQDFETLLRHTKDGTERIKSIVERLRGFSHLSDSGYVDANLNTALDDSLTIVWNELKYKATIVKDFGDLPPVCCNIGELKQVFVNLLINAAHAIAARGEITLRTRVSGETVLISVSDTGCGIPRENLKRIFDPFFTTKAVGKGTGLGLWISATIVQKHGGVIETDSVVGEGTTFTVRIPVKQITTVEGAVENHPLP
jgi:PAS domain S-box-containing protein